MAVLHRYAASNESDGYYIYAIHNGANVTYQVSALARKILDRLSSCTVDERLPDEVFYTLHRLDLIFTHRSGVEQLEELTEISTTGDTKTLSDVERKTLFDELLSHGDLSPKERKELQENRIEEGIEAASLTALHSNWVPSRPDDPTVRGTIMRTFQDDEWGFINSDEAEIEEDVFFHIDELEGIRLAPEMVVEFTYEQNEEGYLATHLRRLVDSYGREVEPEESGSNSSFNEDGVRSDELSEGDRVEALVDSQKGQKGLGEKGYLHMHHRQRSNDGFLQISRKNELIPVNEWVIVRITAINDGYAESLIESEPTAEPVNGEIPLYVP